MQKSDRVHTQLYQRTWICAFVWTLDFWGSFNEQCYMKVSQQGGQKHRWGRGMESVANLSLTSAFVPETGEAATALQLIKAIISYYVCVCVCSGGWVCVCTVGTVIRASITGNQFVLLWCSTLVFVWIALYSNVTTIGQTMVCIHAQFKYYTRKKCWEIYLYKISSFSVSMKISNVQRKRKSCF